VGNVWPDNETLGLPTGMNLRPMGLADLLGLSPGCEFGSICVPIGQGLITSVTGNGTAVSPYTFHVLVLAGLLDALGAIDSGSSRNLAAQANRAFVRCVIEGGLAAVGAGLTETVFDASKSKEVPSTGDIIVNITNASLDLQKECLGGNPLADLSPNYRGLFHYGDPGVDLIFGPFFGW